VIKKYALAIKLGFIAILAGIAAYYKRLSERRKAQIKDIELGSARSALDAQADAQKADIEALKRGERRTIDEIERARRGDRDHFE
jgi:pantothenate kinase type III